MNSGRALVSARPASQKTRRPAPKPPQNDLLLKMTGYSSREAQEGEKIGLRPE